jgi:transposase
MYQVRRVNIGKTDQLDELAHECGRLYSQTLASFWRTVRHKGIWLKPKHLMRWTGTQYEAVATYKIVVRGHPQGDREAGIDLGEIHMAVSHDGEQTHILNGRLLRSKRQYQNKLKAKLNRLIDVKKRDSRRSKRLAR